MMKNERTEEGMMRNKRKESQKMVKDEEWKIVKNDKGQKGNKRMMRNER